MFGDTLSVHNNKPSEVFARLRMHNLKLQPDKCEFLRKDVTYLGHKVTTQWLLPDPDQVVAVREFPTSTNTRQLKRYLGLSGFYRRFIPNFCKIAKPLNELLKKILLLSGIKEQKTHLLL